MPIVLREEFSREMQRLHSVLEKPLRDLKKSVVLLQMRIAYWGTCAATFRRNSKTSQYRYGTVRKTDLHHHIIIVMYYLDSIVYALILRKSYLIKATEFLLVLLVTSGSYLYWVLWQLGALAIIRRVGDSRNLVKVTKSNQDSKLTKQNFDCCLLRVAYNKVLQTKSLVFSNNVLQTVFFSVSHKKVLQTILS